MTSKKEEAALLTAAALDMGALERPARRQPRVAMSAVTDFTGELSRTEDELEGAKAKLALYEGAWPTRKLDPRRIRPSRFANRVPASFEGSVFEAFKKEIASAGGNVQPVKVRPIAGDGKPGSFEIVFGHRRHRACLELGIEVLATVHENMSDKELFEEMTRENEARANLSAYELAIHYQRAIDAKLYRNWAVLSAALGKTKGLMSRYSALAELPKPIVDAFASPNQIQPKWAAKLRQVLEVDRDAVLRAAADLKGRGLGPKATFSF